MNNENMGKFISALRKSKQMTQKDLADQLHITDKAVSKWERGLSYPDISLLSSIARILDVSISELLNGEKQAENGNEMDMDHVLAYADESVTHKTMRLQHICALIFSILLVLGIVVCTICDLAISRDLSWSLYVSSSSIFAWFLLFPILNYGEKGLRYALLALTIFIIPYLYVLQYLINDNDQLFPMGAQIAIVSIIFLWISYGICKRSSLRKSLATAISLLLLIPLSIIINLICSKIMSIPMIDIWDMIGYSIIIILSLSLFTYDFITHKKNA